MPEAPKRVSRRLARVATPGAAPNKVDRRSSLRTDAATMVTMVTGAIFADVHAATGCARGQE